MNLLFMQNSKRNKMFDGGISQYHFKLGIPS